MVHHIYVYGVIGWEASSKSVIEQIQASKPAKGDTVLVHIHSPGGYVSEGYAIYDALKSQAVSLGFTLETQAEGECKSIATVVFLAAEVRKITSNSDFMIHNPWGGMEGDAAELHKYADDLEKEESKLAKFYAEKTGIEEAELRRLMGEETYYTAKEAVSMGFATIEIDTMKAVALFMQDKSQSTNSNKFKMAKTNFLDKFKGLIKALEGVKALDTTLEDGTAISVETAGESIAVGDTVTFTESGELVPDATHVLADGMQIVTVSGVITEIIEAQASSAAEIAALKAENAELKALIEQATPMLEAAQALAKIDTKALDIKRNIQTRKNIALDSKDKKEGSFTAKDLLNRANPTKKA